VEHIYDFKAPSSIDNNMYNNMIENTKKVLIVVQTLNNGGAERVACDIANGLQERGVTVAVQTNIEIQVKYHLNDTIRVFGNPQYRFLKKLNRFCIVRTVKTINEFKPDVIIGIMWGEALTAKIASYFANNKVKVIFSDHDSFERPQGDSIRRFFTKRFLSRLCDCYTVLTNADKDLCEKHGIKNAYVMNNPLTLTPISTTLLKKNIILAAGRLDAWHYKGFDILIRAWGKICNKHSSWILEIAGRGSFSSIDYLKNIARDCGCADCVNFIGYVADMGKKYQESSVFVLSSRYEGFGLVLIEAMSQGCACIACDYKGRQADIISDGVDGLLANVDDIDDLAQKLDRLLSDEMLLKKLQGNAPSNLLRYSIDYVAESWEHLINNLCV